MVFVEGGDAAAHRNVPTPKADRERFCLSDAEVLELADYAIEDRGALRARPDGHRVGQGRHRRQDLHRPGAAGDRGLPATGVESRDLRARQGPARCSSRAASVGERIARARRASSRAWRSSAQFRPGRGAGRRHHDAGLGAGHEDGGGDRHQPRRAHLPRRHHRARARDSRRRRRRERDAHVAERRDVTVSCAEGDIGRVYEGERALRGRPRRGRAIWPGRRPRS